ncbi:hypothetical protein CEUSTIGMA_g9616.t1 [Chlamydomonas eustigma]|uniref:Uncharacterized protein n=1 Tax=Chlamydomonas eustigma TaxID=1157962 RepID=A0A250XGI6_9CHLO|nr:hypothetical protein CEUSTIGMA_g9616.t1 [Chlamydomonas eustigma]|eukprot:GAX82188.1 hypothetical protein CEUSTIGMA_g9616.t1 [Chlamydomonas eustigma]
MSRFLTHNTTNTAYFRRSRHYKVIKPEICTSGVSSVKRAGYICTSALNRRACLVIGTSGWILQHPWTSNAEDKQTAQTDSSSPSSTEKMGRQSPGASTLSYETAPSQAVPGMQVPTPSQSNGTTSRPLDSIQLDEEATKRLLQEEEERRKLRKRKKGRIRELEEIRGELAEKELILLEKEKELLEKEQDVIVLREELELERKLRALLSKEKEKAEEEAALAMGLCTGGAMLP